MKSNRLTRQKAIRQKCLDCSNYQPKEVRLCPVLECPLWRYRLGYEDKNSLKKQEDTS